MAGLSAALALMKSPVCARSRAGAGPGSAASRLLPGPRVCVGKTPGGTKQPLCLRRGVHEPREGNVRERASSQAPHSAPLCPSAAGAGSRLAGPGTPAGHRVYSAADAGLKGSETWGVAALTGRLLRRPRKRPGQSPREELTRGPFTVLGETGQGTCWPREARVWSAGARLHRGDRRVRGAGRIPWGEGVRRTRRSVVRPQREHPFCSGGVISSPFRNPGRTCDSLQPTGSGGTDLGLEPRPQEATASCPLEMLLTTATQGSQRSQPEGRRPHSGGPRPAPAARQTRA